MGNIIVHLKALLNELLKDLNKMEVQRAEKYSFRGYAQENIVEQHIMLTSRRSQQVRLGETAI